MSNLRILCLHGMVQNGSIFRKKTAVLRKKLKSADLVYVTGPHLIDDPRYTSEEAREAAADPNAPEELKPYGWWYPTSTYPNTAEGYYTGFRESVEHLKDILIKEGPFDGIFGFSQGACLAAVMVELLENRALMPDLLPSSFEHPPFKFAIIAAGFKPDSQDATAALFKSKIKTPSIHLIGEADTLIVPERMMALADIFEDPAILKHPGGHFVPTNAVSRNELAAFVAKFE
ncbi:serine hydrolase FSH [Syncephalastrum racemosum]|uniref:Serine hydrolase FSH n=1 Tax=Syncephalastrum racemosum TaxID=13706 RepID=A0A1X2HPJ9_SYNRA|nr:serine hydrolase FSH [Syncephalastrum racemosum]